MTGTIEIHTFQYDVRWIKLSHIHNGDIGKYHLATTKEETKQKDLLYNLARKQIWMEHLAKYVLYPSTTIIFKGDWYK